MDDLSRGTLQNLKHCIDKIEFFEGDLANPEIAEMHWKVAIFAITWLP